MPFTGVPGLGDAKPRAEQRGRAHPLSVHHGWWGVHHRGRAGRLLRPDWEAEAGCVSGERGAPICLYPGMWLCSLCCPRGSSPVFDARYCVCVMFAGAGRVHPSSQQGIVKESSSVVGNTVPLRDTAMLVADEEAGAAAIATSPSRRSSTTMSGGDSRNSKTGAGASMGTSSALGSCPDRSSSWRDVDACDVVQVARAVKGQPAMRGRWVRERPVAADASSHALGEMEERAAGAQPVVVDSGLAVLEDVVSEAAGTLPSTPPDHTSLPRRRTIYAPTITLS